jgi:CRP/FNR family transcriptional regulator
LQKNNWLIQNFNPLSNNSCDTTLLLIRGFDIFAHITDEEYEELNLVHNFVEAKKGEFIYFPSQNKRKLYFTKQGFIKIGYIDADGNECIKEIIQKGEVFGQLTLEQNNLEDEFAQAYKADVSLCAFNIEDFFSLLQKKPGMALSFSIHLGNKVKKVENRLLNLLNKNVLSRLIHLLLSMVDQVELKQTGKTIVERYLTHEDMAKLIGSTRQTVTTTLTQLCNEEFIAINKTHIEILKPDELKKLADVGQATK